MININNRLKQVSSFVDQNSKSIIDVGCDHALLDIYLYQKYPHIKLIASDINEGPLKHALENLKKYNLENKIKLTLADGISCIEEDADTIIISGMGTETIIDILTEDKSKLKNIKKLILSSNNKYQLLREKIIQLGFKINNEKIVYEDNKYYIIIEFIKGKISYTKKELYFGPVLLKNKNKLFYDYYNIVKNTKEKILKELPTSSIKSKNLKKELELLVNELNQ